MSINYFITFIISLSSGIFFIVLLRKLALRYRVLVVQGMPLIGGASIGLAFFLACLISSFIFGVLSQEARGIILASSIMLIFGLLDDWRELSILAKFLAQIVACYLLIKFGIRTQIVDIGNLLNIIITFIWVIGITNAFNHLDVIDGLAGGCAIIASSIFFIISFLNADIKTAFFSLALTGAILGFLKFNLPPAKVYMGNSGSHFLGFVLSAIALVVHYAPLERKVALFSPLLILGFPIFDTTFLIFMRMRQKRPIFRKSNDHLALRFLALGYSKKKTLLILLAYALFFSLCGLALTRFSNLSGGLIIISTLLLSLSVIKKIGKVAV